MKQLFFEVGHVTKKDLKIGMKVNTNYGIGYIKDLALNARDYVMVTYPERNRDILTNIFKMSLTEQTKFLFGNIPIGSMFTNGYIKNNRPQDIDMWGDYNFIIYKKIDNNRAKIVGGTLGYKRIIDEQGTMIFHRNIGVYLITKQDLETDSKFKKIILKESVEENIFNLKEESEVQSVIFDKSKFTLAQAKEWLKKNDYKTDVDEKEDTYRFRQKEPNYKKYATKEIKSGIKLVLGIKSKEK